MNAYRDAVNGSDANARSACGSAKRSCWRNWPSGTATTVRLQRGGKSSSSFREYRTVKTDRYGIFQVRVPRSTTQRYRFVYVDPNTQAAVTSAATGLREPRGK